MLTNEQAADFHEQCKDLVSQAATLAIAARWSSSVPLDAFDFRDFDAIKATVARIEANMQAAR